MLGLIDRALNSQSARMLWNRSGNREHSDGASNNHIGLGRSRGWTIQPNGGAIFDNEAERFIGSIAGANRRSRWSRCSISLCGRIESSLGDGGLV